MFRSGKLRFYLSSLQQIWQSGVFILTILLLLYMTDNLSWFRKLRRTKTTYSDSTMLGWPPMRRAICSSEASHYDYWLEDSYNTVKVYNIKKLEFPHNFPISLPNQCLWKNVRKVGGEVDSNLWCETLHVLHVAGVQHQCLCLNISHIHNV